MVLKMFQVLFTEGLFSGMELAPGFKAPDPNAYDFQVRPNIAHRVEGECCVEPTGRMTR